MIVSSRSPALNSVVGMIFPLATTAALPDIITTLKVPMRQLLIRVAFVTRGQASGVRYLPMQVLWYMPRTKR